jgi:hypothetical protein
LHIRKILHDTTTRMLAESINVLSLSRPLSKSTLLATLEAPLEKSGHRISESVTTLRAPQRLGLHVVAQHELVGVRMQVHLLVHPLRHRMVVVVISSYLDFGHLG